MAGNFALMSLAEVACRAISVGVTLSLTRRLGLAGYGRVEFAFNIVFWLVLLVRDGFEVIAARELARHPRLLRPLVNHVLAVKGLLAIGLYIGLVTIGCLVLKGQNERSLLAVYGLMLLTTALGIDYVYRGLERMGIVALSLCLRTVIYAAGVGFWVTGPERILWVPAWLAVGEAVGIALVWSHYVRQNGWPHPLPGARFLGVFFKRGRTVLLVQLAQTVLASIDLVVVGWVCDWDAIGLFGAPHRMVTAILTFGVIFQQVVFPSLARSWRKKPEHGRRALDVMTRVLAMGLLPIAIGTTVLSERIVALLFPHEYQSAGSLLAIGIWRAPLLTLAFLYQTALIAFNREAVGVRMLITGAVVSGPFVAVLLTRFGLLGAAGSIVLTALALSVAGYVCLAREGRNPKWHHHVIRPLVASAAMAFACMALKDVHVVLTIVAGAFVYLTTLWAIGGISRSDIHALLSRG